MDMKITREIAERRATRQNLVRTADRSEKIRTYNYAQASWLVAWLLGVVKLHVLSRTASPTTALVYR